MTIVAVGQTDLEVGNLPHNRQRIRRLLDDADHAGVQVLVLPELANSGYVFADRAEAAACAEHIPEGATCRLLAEWSQGGRLVVCGICERADDGTLYNAAAVFASGEHKTTYRKLHLFGKEGDLFAPGDTPLPVIAHGGFRYGVMICFDWLFPEAARTLALQGAHIILHPANLVLPYCQAAMITRSIENRIFTATANRYGEERGTVFSGMSQMTSPRGAVIVRAAERWRGVLSAALDLALAEDKMITERNHVLNDRRPEWYRL
ncbi:MAG: acyltransferase [Anaerolineae bacterium]|nr:acyltransferase [Anaerolineae bacterium]